MDKVWAKCPEHIGALAKSRTCVGILTYVRWHMHLCVFVGYFLFRYVPLCNNQREYVLVTSFVHLILVDLKQMLVQCFIHGCQSR